jgi:hypothetical protein
MQVVVGPILVKQGCYAFDLWTAEEGLSRGYAYRRIEDAHYARKVEIQSRQRQPDAAVVCATLDEFTTAVTEREATYSALISNLKPQSMEVAQPPSPTFRALFESDAETVATR